MVNLDLVSKLILGKSGVVEAASSGDNPHFGLASI